MRRFFPLVLGLLAACGLPEAQYMHVTPSTSAMPVPAIRTAAPASVIDAPVVPAEPERLLLASATTLREGPSPLVTRGVLLGDVAFVNGRQDAIPDFVLSEGRSGVRLSGLAWPQPLLGRKVVARGVIDGRVRGRVLRIERLEPYEEPVITSFTIDDRAQEPDERLGILPSLHVLRVRAEHAAGVEFFFDPGNGPLRPIGRDDTPLDGFTAEWNPLPGDIGTVRAMVLTEFGESLEKAALKVRVGNVPFGW